MTPLHLASRRGNKQIVNMLLEHKADPKLQDNRKWLALHYAAEGGYLDICEKLLAFYEGDTSAYVNLKNKVGMTPLHLASRRGNKQIVNMLLEHKADPKLQDNRKWLALYYAAEGGYLDICEKLFDLYKGNTSLENSVSSPLKLAAEKGWTDAIKVMAGEKENWDRSNWNGLTSLHFAARLNNFETVSALIELGCNVNAQTKTGNTPVMEAAFRGHFNSVKALVDGGARLDIQNKWQRNVLHLSSSDPCGKVMSFLLDAARANGTLEKIINQEDKRGYTPLHWATLNSGDRNALLLLDAGAAPNVKSWFNLKTPLHLAVQYEKVEVVKRLLEIRELQKEPKLKNNETPFHLSAKLNSPEICMILLNKGVSKNAVNIRGETAIHLCAKHGHPLIMKVLIKEGVDQSTKDHKGADALHHAADRSDVECCKILIEQNIKRCTAEDEDGNYPLDIAYSKCHEEVFAFLLNSISDKMSKNLTTIVQAAIRRIARDALQNDLKWAVAAIVDSGSWETGFGAAVVSSKDPNNTTGRDIPCNNFRNLISKYPELAKRVMNKCITQNKTTGTLTYNFTIFEDNYYVPIANSPVDKTPVEKTPDEKIPVEKIPVEKTPDEKRHRTLPYDKKTWKLLPKAVDMYSNKLRWKEEHPIELMSRKGGVRLVQHELPMAWLNHKFMSYTWVPFTILFLLQVFCALSLMGYMWTARTWESIERKANVSVEEICSEVPDSLSDTTASIAFYTLTVILFTSDILLEGMCKLRVRPTSFGATFGILMFTCLMTALLVPTPHCNTLLVGVKWVYLWECGILCILIAWFRVVNTISKLPAVSLFTPVTQTFVLEFIKIVMFVGATLGVFAFIFCLLFPGHPPFQRFPESLIKAFTWMYGDLGYDDTFVEGEVHYQFFANFMFLLFLSVTAGVIFTLVKSPTVDDDLVYHQRTVKFAEMILKFDVCFPCCNKSATPGGEVPDNCFKYCPRRHVIGKKCENNRSEMSKVEKRFFRYMLGSFLFENPPESLTNEQVSEKAG